MKKVVSNLNSMLLFFWGHIIISLVICFLYGFNGFDQEEFYLTFWFFYGFSIVYALKIGNIICSNKYIIVNASSRMHYIIVFIFVAIIFLITLIKALNPQLVNFVEMKKYVLILETCLQVYCLTRGIFVRSRNEHTNLENGIV